MIFCFLCNLCPCLDSKNAVSFYTCCCRKLIWLQQRPENATPRIALLVSVTYEALMELYWSRACLCSLIQRIRAVVHPQHQQKTTDTTKVALWFYPWWIIRGAFGSLHAVWEHFHSNYKAATNVYYLFCFFYQSINRLFRIHVISELL